VGDIGRGLTPLPQRKKKKGKCNRKKKNKGKTKCNNMKKQKKQRLSFLPLLSILLSSVFAVKMQLGTK
jgi:hypothetical protein